MQRPSEEQFVQRDELIDDDYEAAQELLKRHPEFREQHPDASVKYAVDHASLGTSRFQLHYGLRPPHNAYERIALDMTSGRISMEEARSRTQEADRAPLDRETLESLRIRMDEKLVYYSRVLQIALNATQLSGLDLPGRNTEQHLARYVREMTAPVGLSKPRLDQIVSHLEDCRIARGLTRPKLKAWEEMTITRIAFAAMMGLRDLMEDESPFDTELKISLCYKLIEFPPPKELSLQVAEEFAIGRLALPTIGGQGEKQSERSPVASSVPSTDHVAPAALSPPTPDRTQASDGVSAVPIAASSEQVASQSDSKGNEKRLPNLANWAVGAETESKWWLFHFRQGGFRQWKRLKIPKGNPSRLLFHLAECGEALSSEEAADLFRPRYPKYSAKALQRVVTDALMKLKSAIRRAIAEIAGCTAGDIADPIPNVRPGWRATIRVGFAVYDDNKNLVFRDRQHLGEDR